MDVVLFYTQLTATHSVTLTLDILLALAQSIFPHDLTLDQFSEQPRK